MALYVYGLMRTEEARVAVGALAGAGKDRAPIEIQTVAHGGVSALVSGVSESGLRLRRESALAHTDTLGACFQHGPVLPVRFGTVVADEVALKRDFLVPRAAELLARLEALEGMAEMQVKASYQEEPLLRSILATSPGLAEAAARIRALPPAATHFDRISLGEAVHGAVQARRHQDAERLIGELRSLSVTINLRETHHEREVLNASFLVAEDRLEQFDKEVERLSNELAGEMSFKLIGPMPPHSFADLPWEREAPPGRSAWD